MATCLVCDIVVKIVLMLFIKRRIDVNTDIDGWVVRQQTDYSDRLMGGWMDSRTNGQTTQIDRQIDGWMDREQDKWTDNSDRQMDGWMDGQMAGQWTDNCDGWIDRFVN